MKKASDFKKMNLYEPDFEHLSNDWQRHESGGRVGARIFKLYEQKSAMINCSFVEFLPGSSTKPHRHEGIEYIYVVRGAFIDEYGVHKAGELLLYGENTIHSWESIEGALLYVVWSGPTVSVN